MENFAFIIEWLSRIGGAIDNLATNSYHWVTEHKSVAISVISSLIIAICAQLFNHSLARRREKNPIKRDDQKGEKIRIVSFEVKNSHSGCTTELLFRLAPHKKLNSLNATITIDTIRSWDFPTGESVPHLEYIDPTDIPDHLLISPTENARSKTAIIFYNNINGQKELKLGLYTKYCLTDRYKIERPGVTLFMLKLTLSVPGFQDWTKTAIAQMTGGYAYTFFQGSITKGEITAQQLAAKAILQAAEDGAYIDQTIPPWLRPIAAAYESSKP
jgi:hypothetical protein